MGLRDAWREARAEVDATLPLLARRTRVTGPLTARRPRPAPGLPDKHDDEGTFTEAQPFRPVAPPPRWRQVRILGGNPVLRECSHEGALVVDQHGQARHREHHDVTEARFAGLEERVRALEDRLDPPVPDSVMVQGYPEPPALEE